MLAQPSHQSQTLDEVIRQYIIPDAAEIDSTGRYPAETMHALGEAGAFAHHVGESANIVGAVEAIAAVSAHCLSTGFSMWCQSALSLYVDRTPNQTLATRLRHPIASARILGGTGLSNPMKAFSEIESLTLNGTRMLGGYRVRGRLNWVSNIASGHVFAIVFATETQPVMAIVNVDTNGLRLLNGAEFIGLESTATHTTAFQDVFIPDTDVISSNAIEFIPTIRQHFVALQLGMGFGLTQGIIDAMRVDQRGRALAADYPVTPDSLAETLVALRARFTAHLSQLDDPGQAAFHQLLAIRRDVALLTLDAARAELVQSGARGYLRGSAVHRRQREAHFVAIVTPSLKHIAKALASK